MFDKISEYAKLALDFVTDNFVWVAIIAVTLLVICIGLPKCSYSNKTVKNGVETTVKVNN